MYAGPPGYRFRCRLHRPDRTECKKLIIMFYFIVTSCWDTVFICSAEWKKYLDYNSQVEGMKNLHIIIGALLCVLSPAPSCSFPFWRSRLDPIPESSTDNVECFLDYMELGVPRRQMDGLLLWLSRVMKFPVSLSSLNRSNRLISRCRYALDMDSNRNLIFRVHYSACNVQTQNGFHVLEIHMLKKTSGGNGRSDRYLMRCPAVTAAMGREKVRCDPNYVQVSRPMPLENANNQDWFLLFRDELVVSVEDASLIGVEVEISKSWVTVKGLRDQLLSPKEFIDRYTDVLPLWIGHGLYAYSMEASCPLVTQSPGEEVIVHIPKQRMGLVKRGSYITETLTLRNIVVESPINVTVTENKHFVMVNIPASDILQTQDCTTQDKRQGTQAFYSVDLVLEFAEVIYPMNWTLENYYTCTVLSPDTAQQETLSESNKNVQSSVDQNGTIAEEDKAIQSNVDYPLSLNTDPGRFIITTSSITSKKAKVDSVTPTGSFIEGSGEHLGFDISGSGEYPESNSDQINATRLADFGNVLPNSSSVSLTFPSSMTLETKHPNLLNLLITGPPHRQDQQSKISNDHLSNSTMNDEPKNLRVSSQMFSTLASTILSNDIRRKNETPNINTLKHEETRQTMENSGVSKVIKHRGSVTYSGVDKQEDFTKPLHSQGRISSSEKKPKDDTDLWEELIGDTLVELLDETVRDGLISPVYRHDARRRSENESSQRMKKKSVLNAQEKTKTEISGYEKRPAGDLQHLTRGEQQTAEASMLSSHHIKWLIFNSIHEDMLYNTSSEREAISSAEQLIMVR